MKKVIKIWVIYCCITVLAACSKEEYQADPYSLWEIRSLYKGHDLTLPRSKVTGVVISDAAAQNIPAGQLVVQQGNKGITLDFGAGAAIPAAFGDSVAIDVTGYTLTRRNGTLLVAGVQPDRVQQLRSNCSVAPLPLTLQQLSNGFDNYESVLVQVSANISPTPTRGDVYAGNRILNDGTDSSIVLHTEAGAAFAKEQLPANASFTGIARYATAAHNSADTVKQLWLRRIQDVQNASGPLYPNFPEGWENSASKTGWPAASVTFPSGSWLLDNAVRQNNVDDRFTGFGIRMNQKLNVSAYLQMNFDLPDGASKVTLKHNVFGTDPGSEWLLEYSTDGGVTWQQAGNRMRTADKTPAIATFMLDIKGAVRFRVNKLGLGSANNGRLCIDDLAVYRSN